LEEEQNPPFKRGAHMNKYKINGAKAFQNPYIYFISTLRALLSVKVEYEEC